MRKETRFGTFGGWILWGTGQPSAGWKAIYITPSLYISIYRCWRNTTRQVLIEFNWLRWGSQFWWKRKEEFDRQNAPVSYRSPKSAFE